jgi:phenylacetate-coenzyme A ligase PaaK-like adenylate-forming protein
MKKLFELIYYSLPLSFQNIAISIFGYYWYRRRFGGVFKSELEKSKQRSLWTEREWKDWQETMLKKLLNHSIKTVPYYQDIFADHNITDESIKNFRIEDLSRIPVLHKNEMRRFADSKLLSNEPEHGGAVFHTSGSTGTPLKIIYSLGMQQKYSAIYEANVRNWAGLNLKCSRGVIGGRRIIKEGVNKGPYYRYNMIEKQVYFSAYHISKETVQDYVEGMWKYKIEYLEGYASSNYYLARFIEEMDIKAPKLKAVLTSSEKLTDEMRKTFKRVYKCEAFDSYNGVDLCNLISECEYHRLHVVSDAGIIEVLNNDGQQCKPGETGEVVATGLLNFDQPLIRYQVGDLVKIAEDQNCPCKRNLLVIDEIIGRVEDMVIGPDGREMRRFHGITIDIPGIVESQIIQHELSKFEIKLVVSQVYSNNSDLILKKRMISQLGDINLDVNIVESIARSPNGKFKSVISHIQRG